MIEQEYDMKQRSQQRPARVVSFGPRVGACLLVWLVLIAGCTESRHTEVAPKKDEAGKDIEPDIRLASWSEVEELVDSQRGKVVVLDVWSTWCVPCIREFPHLVELQQEYGEQIACISLNCNYTGAEGEEPVDAREEIAAFLTKQQATFPNVISTTPDEELFTVLDAAAVPIVRVYDKNGALAKQFVNDDGEYGATGFSYGEHIEPLVKELLEKDGERR